MSQTVWITGAAGFSAGHLATLLRREEAQCRIIGLDRNPAYRGVLDEYHPIDISDYLQVKELAQVAPPRWVFHLAAAIPPASEESLWQVNVGGTRMLIEAIASCTGRQVRVLVTSSAAVYGRSQVQVNEGARACGINPYGRSKWAQELVALAAGREFGVDVVIARTFNLIGPGLPKHLLAGSVCAQCARSGSNRICVGDLSSFRDFIDIRDAVDAYRQIIRRGRTRGIYNVCSGRATRVRTMVQQLTKLAGGGFIVDEAEPRNKGRGTDRSWGDNSRLKALGWKQSLSLSCSLKDMLAYTVEIE